jgi:ATP-dependent Lhr-like helicase
MVSRGRIIPFNGMDLVTAAALEGAVRDREIEETWPVENPLDLLAQIILALCVEKKRHTEELYRTLRGFYVFRELPRSAYDGVIRMLTGYYAAARVRELKPRLYLDREAGTGPDTPRGELTAAEGVLPLLYMSGGMITNRGYYSLRLPEGAKIGELDEEFVWERRPGDCFEFGTRSWSITAIGPEAVEAVPLDKPSDYAPFWKAEAVFRSPVLVRRVLELFDRFSGRNTVTGAGLSESAGETMRSFILNQQNAQGRAPLPGLNRFPIEIIDDPPDGGDVYPVLLHTFRGGAVNYPLSMALAQDLEERTGVRIEAMPDDTTVLILLPRSLRQGSPGGAAEAPESVIHQSLLALGEPAASAGEADRPSAGASPPEGRRDGLPRGVGLFRRRLEASGIFGAAFREAAERSLLLPKASFGKRTPLWITRQRSKRLFDAVSGYDDFPVTAEAWRSCLQDQFDMKGFAALLAGIREGTVGISFFHTRVPSPFARDIVWKETNALMYEYDERPDLRNKGGTGKVSLADRIIREALGKGARRPSLNGTLTADFEARLRRELPLWAPADALTLGEWVKERIAIPLDEWEILLAAVPAELRDVLAADPGLGGRISPIRREGAALASVVHRDWAETWRQEGIAQLGPWLRYEGPVSLERIAAVFGVTAAEADGAVDALAENEELVRDVSVTTAAGTGLVCDRENLDLLLRLTRKKARPAVRERPAALLIPYLALRQGLRLQGQDPRAPGIPPPWKTLAGYSAPAALWESDIFPARLGGYGPETLDREIAAGNLLWYGAGRERTGFCGPEDLDLIFPKYRPPPFGGDSAAGERGYFDTPRDFWEIKDRLGKGTLASVQELWGEVWKGLLSADSFEPVRRGIAGGFIPRALQREFDGDAAPGAPAVYPWGRRRIPRALRDRWKAGPPVLGRWFSIALAEGPLDLPGSPDSLDEEALNRDRVRLLLNRWGVLARPLLEREEPALSWGRLLPTIRRLELAGELMAGRFFAGINSLQFARADIDRELEAAAETGIYWMNAADPASPAGLGPLVHGIPGLDEGLPPRTAATRLCFRGSELIAVSGRNGRELRIFIPPDDADIPEALNFLAFRRSGSTGPLKKILIERVNGKPAAQSEYAGALKALGFLPDRSCLVLW